MNIYALEGHRVKVYTDEKGKITNGYESDKETVKKYLEIDKEYEVEYTIVHQSSTAVYLKGFKYSFNSVMFEDVDIQTEEQDEMHDDYSFYN